MISNNVCPCKDCVAPKRHCGCHTTCKEYKDWDILHKQELEAIRQARNSEDEWISIIHRNAIKRRKKYGNHTPDRY